MGAVMNSRSVGLILALAGAQLLRAAAADISFTPAALDFKYQAGGALPASQTLQIKSTGATALSFTLSVTGPLPYSAQWLSLSAGAGTTSASIKVYVNPTGMPAGSYGGNIVITSPAAANVTHTVPVTLEVGDPAATLTASTGSLTFNYVSGGGLPGAQPVVLMTNGGALTASITISGGTWLKATPSGSIALVGLPGTVSVSVDPTGLAPGSYSGKITFASTNAANKSISVNVTLNVTAGVPTISSLWPPGALANSTDLVITVTGTNFFSTSAASYGNTALATTMLSPTTLLVTIPATLLTTPGNLGIVVTTPTAAAPSTASNFVVYGPGPQIWAVANSASYTTSTVSPGGIVTIYGVGLGPATLTTFPGTSPLPTSLPATGAATSVTIDGKPAPLLYTSATQVNCIVPYAAAAKSGTKVDLVLTYNSVDSTAFKVSVVDADPGVFTVDSSGMGQGAILNYDSTTGDYTVNGAANAAAKGSIIVIYTTGFGVTTCTDAQGSTCAATAPDETLLITGNVVPAGAVTVTIGNQSAAVQAAVSPIGSVPGLLQINATVPTGVAVGKAVPVVVSVGQAQSQAKVTMAVK
jgi:uncharacterized protein (TIGR03437 family)